MREAATDPRGGEKRVGMRRKRKCHVAGAVRSKVPWYLTSSKSGAPRTSR